ncbi:Asparagine-rich zinc finger protein AZF1 [Porphyridium purpureum]|uniref:Asparagine-rich zinc finger protein AZF1 n=1 Tax=Porphyridium purpureum TaxID=35688 RepID=A0A5J4Z0T1_PORPP|nr:Asparagine-rich zinc finger protein AZF1 [Porphyridium purpureum]|eukprot:POR8496..scf208_2
MAQRDGGERGDGMPPEHGTSRTPRSDAAASVDGSPSQRALTPRHRPDQADGSRAVRASEQSAQYDSDRQDSERQRRPSCVAFDQSVSSMSSLSPPVSQERASSTPESGHRSDVDHVEAKVTDATSLGPGDQVVQLDSRFRELSVAFDPAFTEMTKGLAASKQKTHRHLQRHANSVVSLSEANGLVSVQVGATHLPSQSRTSSAATSSRSHSSMSDSGASDAISSNSIHIVKAFRALFRSTSAEQNRTTGGSLPPGAIASASGESQGEGNSGAGRDQRQQESQPSRDGSSASGAQSQQQQQQSAQSSWGLSALIAGSGTGRAPPGRNDSQFVGLPARPTPSEVLLDPYEIYPDTEDGPAAELEAPRETYGEGADRRMAREEVDLASSSSRQPAPAPNQQESSGQVFGSAAWAHTDEARRNTQHLSALWRDDDPMLSNTSNLAFMQTDIMPGHPDGSEADMVAAELMAAVSGVPGPPWDAEGNVSPESHFLRGVDYEHQRDPQDANTSPSEHLAYRCLHCDRQFRQKSHCREHIHGVHKNLKPFQCPHCDKRFSYGGNLRQHVQQAHSTERPFQCSKCTKKFKMPARLRAHMDRMHGRSASGQDAGGSGPSAPVDGDPRGTGIAPSRRTLRSTPGAGPSSRPETFPTDSDQDYDPDFEGDGYPDYD